MGDARKEILILDELIKANQSSALKGAIDLRGLRAAQGGYQLVVQTRNGGASAPTGALSIVVQMQEADPDRLVFADVSGWVNTAIAAIGDQVAYDPHTGVLSTRVRAKVTASAATAWNDGTRVRVWIVGEGN